MAGLTDAAIKKKIISSITPDKLIYDGENYRTFELNKTFRLFGLKTNKLGRDKKEKISISADQSDEAPPLGLPECSCRLLAQIN